MTRRRRGGPRLSAPLAILAGVILTVAAGRLAVALIVAAVTGAAIAAAYAAGASRRNDRQAARVRAPAVHVGGRADAAPARQVRTSPHGPKRGPGVADGHGSLPAPAPPQPDPAAALRATLRARADQVSQRVPPPAKRPERAS